MKRNFLFLILLSTSITFLYQSCSKDDSDDAVSTPTKIIVTVVDETDFPVYGASVSCGSVNGTTDATGMVTLTGVPVNDGKFNVEVNADGFFPGYRNITKIGSGANNTSVKLIEKQILGSIDANGSGSLTGTGFRLELNGGGFKDETGNDVSGDVTAYGRYMGADNMQLLSETMPGGDFSAIDQSGQGGILESYGFTAFDFRDQSGNRIVPNNGAAQVAITVPQNALDQINSEGAQVWIFNNESFSWTEAGDVSAVGSEIFMPVTSSTFGNCDKMRAKGTVTGRFTCEDLPIPGVRVSLRGASGYAMEYTTYTNENGNFLVEVGIPTAGGTYTITFGSYSETISVSADQITDIGTLEDCGLSGQDGNPRFNLQWSAEADLDLYVKSPNGEIIYYGNSFSSDGGQLDIDCLCSCPASSENVFWENGPSGTYEYWVDYYGSCGATATSASFTITVRDNDSFVVEQSGTVVEFGQSQTWTYVK